MKTFMQGVEKLMTALNVPGIPLVIPIGTNSEFESERNKWLENSTQDSILDEFAEYIISGARHINRGSFTSEEIKNLEGAFAAHANKDQCWDQNSLQCYLEAHLPDDEDNRAILRTCASSLWELVIYFSQWPFTSPSKTVGTPNGRIVRISFYSWVRAIAFLCGRYRTMFERYHNPQDADIPGRTDRLILEHIFRALAADVGSEPTGAASPLSMRSSCSQLDDVLDTLNTVQPILNEFTHRMPRDMLDPLASRLLSSPHGPTRPDLSSLAIPTAEPGGILSLLEMLVSLLTHASKFDPTHLPDMLKQGLEQARLEFQNADSISFDSFVKLLGADDELNIYDAAALLFNTIPNPKSLTEGITINFHDGEEKPLFVYCVRKPGSIMSS